MNYKLFIFFLVSTAALSGMLPPKGLDELDAADLALYYQMMAEIAAAEDPGVVNPLSKSAPRPIPGQLENDCYPDSEEEDEQRLESYMYEWDEKVGSFEKLEDELRRSGKLGRRGSKKKND